MAIYQSRALADVAVEKLRVFAQPQRLMILSYLLGGERQVADIEAATGVTQPALSQQLAELRRADLVKTRREAKQVHYRLADDAAALCVRTLEAMFGADDLSAPQTAPAPRPVRPRETPSVVRPQTIGAAVFARLRSEEHTSELQSLMRLSSAVFSLKKTTPICHHTSSPI